MSIEEQKTTIINDVEIKKELSGAEIIKNNIVEINSNAKNEYLRIARIRDKILDRLEREFESMDIKEVFKMFEKLANIALASRELDNDLVNPKSQTPSVILSTETNKKDSIEEFAGSLDSDSQKKFDALYKIMASVVGNNQKT